MTKKVIVIGGGPAGIEAATAAATVGADVTLISEEKVGGRAGWHSLLPSKVWLNAADHLTRSAPGQQLNFSQILAEIQTVKESWYRQQMATLERLSVKIIYGTAKFNTPHQITVDYKTDQGSGLLEADAFIVATGSVPIFPPNLKPDGQRVIAPRFASQLDSLPEKVIVIGAGATGCEFTYLFNRLGADVTWIVDQYGVLPKSDPAASQFLTDVLVSRGVNLVAGHLADHLEKADDQVTVVLANGERHTAGLVFIAIGRKPDLERVDLKSIQLGLNGVPITDSFGQTVRSSIYLVGDAAGHMPLVANRAMAEAWVAGQYAAGRKPAYFNPTTVIKAVYTDPQVAEVGPITDEGLHHSQVSFGATLKTHLTSETDGFVKLFYDDQRRVRGGVAVGPQAADVLAPVALAIQTEATLDDLAVVYAAHPTITELAFMAARQSFWNV